jgi:hypothetical protein
MPPFATRPETTSGVSAANVVATMEVPMSHQGSDLPETKYSSVLRLARFERRMPTPNDAAR